MEKKEKQLMETISREIQDEMEKGRVLDLIESMKMGRVRNIDWARFGGGGGGRQAFT